MKNFPIKVNDKEYWISRSCAVVGIVLKQEGDDNFFVLANKRGPGCPDNIGKWNIPCGYVDYDETLEEAISREIFEETGLSIDKNEWELYSINSNPKDSERQNIVIRFFAKYKEEMGTFDSSNSEPNEVDEIKWIDINGIEEYEWAFNQYELLKELRDVIYF